MHLNSPTSQKQRLLQSQCGQALLEAALSLLFFAVIMSLTFVFCGGVLTRMLIQHNTYGSLICLEETEQPYRCQQEAKTKLKQQLPWIKIVKWNLTRNQNKLTSQLSYRIKAISKMPPLLSEVTLYRSDIYETNQGQ